MNKISFRAMGPAALCALILLSCSPSSQYADLILTGGHVYSMAWSDPDADGTPAADAPYDGSWHAADVDIAIKEGQIVAIGSETELQSHRGPDTQVEDLNGAFVLPGLIESHGHLHELGEKAEEINLIGVTTEDEIAERLLAAASDRPAGEWILGSGWDEGEWANNLPTKDFLNTLFPENPVMLNGLRGFGALGNDLTLAAAGVTEESEDPVGGTLVRDANGALTGVLLNNARDILLAAVPQKSLDHRVRILDYGIDLLLESGYVNTHHDLVGARQQPRGQVGGR